MHTSFTSVRLLPQQRRLPMQWRASCAMQARRRARANATGTAEHRDRRRALKPAGESARGDRSRQNEDAIRTTRSDSPFRIATAMS